MELIEVEYEPLPTVFDARRALDPDAPVIRDDLEGRTDNKIYDWEAGDKAACDEVFANADVVVKQSMVYPRVHPAPLEPIDRRERRLGSGCQHEAIELDRRAV